MQREDTERIRKHYDANPESDRLHDAFGRLEFERTRHIVRRFLPDKQCRVLDLGGATGDYAFWLASEGHRVTLVDLSERHITLAQERNESEDGKLERVLQADACSLPFEAESFDVVLNFGPLYHLPSRNDRLDELRGVRRVLHTDGLVISAYISRYSPLFYGYKRGVIEDSKYRRVVDADLRTGVRDGPLESRFFTLAYLHKPDEIPAEVSEAGLDLLHVAAVEGFFYLLPEIDRYMDDPTAFAAVMEYAERLESEPSLMGSTAHILSVARPRHGG